MLERPVDGVVLITLDAPQRRNALTAAMADELLEVLDRVDADAGVGVTVIRGAQGAFCAGAELGDLEAVSRDPVSQENYERLERIYAAFVRVGALRMPSIAAVRGAAVGAGVNLMMATDVRVMADDARVISGFARLGLHPGGGHFQLLARQAGTEAAAVLGVLGAEISGRRAADIGLAWESVPDEVVEGRALELAAGARRDPELARRSVQSLRGTSPNPVPWEVALQAERAPQLWTLRRAAGRVPRPAKDEGRDEEQ